MNIKKLIPNRFHYLLANLKNDLLGGYARTHYSQFAEDVILTKLLLHRQGFYVDVGAHHPKRYSNTYLLSKKGWKGVNIDPNPHTVQLFNKARPYDTNLCVGIGTSDGEQTYYTFSDPAVNTFQEEEAKNGWGKIGLCILVLHKFRLSLCTTSFLPYRIFPTLICLILIPREWI